MTRQNSPKISLQVGCFFVPIVINTNVVCSGRIFLVVREFFWRQSLSIAVVKPVTPKIRIELEFGNTGCWGEGETWESEKKNSRSCKDEEQDRNKDKCSYHCLQPNATIAIDVISFFVRSERVDLIFRDGVAFLRLVKIFCSSSY